MGDDFDTFACSPLARADAFPRPHNGDTKRPAPPAAPLKNGLVPPQLSAWDLSSRSFADQWSPASTVRSTPPFDTQQNSPAAAARPRSSRSRLVEIDLGIVTKTACAASCETTAKRVQPNDSSSSSSGARGRLDLPSKGGKGRGGGLKQATAWLRRVRVAPTNTSDDSIPRDSSPSSVSASVSTSAPRVRQGERPRSRSPLAGSNGPQPSDPTRARVSSGPTRARVSRQEKSYDIMPAVRAPSATVARAREVEAEVDILAEIEEGQVFAATKAAPVAKPAEALPNPTAVVAASPVEVAVVASEAPVACGLVLPYPPTEAEKGTYIQTFRPYIIVCSFISVLTMEAGMWLCTMASPFLYWLGLPAVIVLAYFACYLAVATRGRDFAPDKHAEVVQHGLEEDYLPTVDVFLPVCNEPIELIANTWKYVSALDYPKVTVHVLDDGAKDNVRDLAQVFGFRYKRRDNRPHMKKAGNLRHAFARTSGEAVVIFDADFCPRADFLRETLPYLLDPSIGIVQTPQFFRWSKEQTWVEKGAGTSQEFFYRMEQVNRNQFGASVCVGSCAVYRRAAVAPFGGVAAIEHSEDIHTGCKITEAGYKMKYLPLCLAVGVCPGQPRSFFMQQYRWCAGNLSLVLRREFWMADISAFQKVCFLSGMLYYFFTAIFLFLTPVPVLILIWAKPSAVLWYHMGFAMPSLFFTMVVLPCWCRSFGSKSFMQRIWRSMSVYRVKVIQSYAHVYAIKDSLLGTSAAWVPSGGGASLRSSSGSYNSSVRLLIAWNAIVVVLTIGGAVLRMKESRPYDFVPAVVLVLSSCALSLSTLLY